MWEGGADPTYARSVSAMRAKSAVEFYPASNTTVVSGSPGPGSFDVFAVPDAQGIDHHWDLGDIWFVAWIGVSQHQDSVISDDHQSQADQTQVIAFLLGLAALGNRRLVVCESM